MINIQSNRGIIISSLSSTDNKGLSEFSTKIQTKDGIDYIFATSKSQITERSCPPNTKELISDYTNTWNLNIEAIKLNIDKSNFSKKEKRELADCISKINSVFELRNKKRTRVADIKGNTLIASLIKADTFRKIEMSSSQAKDQISDLADNLTSKIESAKSLEKKFKEYEKYIQKGAKSSSNSNAHPNSAGGRFGYLRTFNMKDFVDKNLDYYDKIEEAKKTISNYQKLIIELKAEINSLSNSNNSKIKTNDETLVNYNNSKNKINSCINMTDCNNSNNKDKSSSCNVTPNLKFNSFNNQNASNISNNNTITNNIPKPTKLDSLKASLNFFNKSQKTTTVVNQEKIISKNSSNKVRENKSNATFFSPSLVENKLGLPPQNKSNNNINKNRFQSVDFNTINQNAEDLKINIKSDNNNVNKINPISSINKVLNNESSQEKILKKSKKILVFYIDQIKQLEDKIYMLKGFRAKLSVGIAQKSPNTNLEYNINDTNKERPKTVKKETTLLGLSIIERKLDETNFNDYALGRTLMDNNNLTRMGSLKPELREMWDITCIKKGDY